MEIKCLTVGKLATNCYLLISEKESALIDPGQEPSRILKETKESGSFLKYIINTHFHPDHISANSQIKKKTEAEILIHKSEKDFIDFVPDKFLKDGEKIKIGKINLKVIHTPGHSKGSICLLGKDFIFSGDTIFKDGFGRTDLPGGSMKEMENSLQKLSKIIEPGMQIYPGHGQSFKVK